MAKTSSKLPASLLACLFIFGLIKGQAQDLTISTSGQTGTSGTNWSISGNVLTVNAGTGSASIHPSVIITHLTNIGDLVIVLPWQSGTQRDILINSSIQYTGSTGRTLSFRSANDIVLASSVQITSSSAALNLVFISRFNTSGSPDNGRVNLANAPTITTNGGHLWVGGGSLSATPWNGLTVGSSTSVTWTSGMYGLPIIGATINTNGGNLYMAGYSNYSGGTITGTSYGIYVDNSTVSTGAGSITLNGSVRGNFSNGGACVLNGTAGAVSLTTTTGSINITGNAYDQASAFSGGSWRVGTQLSGSTSGVTVSSQSGDIMIEGNAAFNSTFNDKEGVNLAAATTNGLRIISRTGNITITGTNIREADGQYCNSIRFGASNNLANTIRIGYDGTNAYSGNITIEGNSIYQRNNQAGAGSIAVQSTGTLTLQPTGNAFTYMRADDANSLRYDDDWNFGTSLSGFTYGKSTNTLGLDLSSALSVAGPITFHVNNFTINENITSTTASDITINILNNFFSDNISRQTISSAGGNIILHADKNADGTGQLDIDYVTFNPGAGNITIRGETFGWTTTSNTDKPYINGTGSFTLEPSDAAFGEALSTSWFHMDQDGNGMSGLTIGKSGNSSSVTFNHAGAVSGLTVAGPITAYGGVITISTPLTSSATGDIFLKSISSLNNCIINNSTISKTGGTGTLTMQGHARVSNTGTITASGSGVKLNVVMWSDFDNSNNDGGVSQSGSITTNGGHVWLGGSNSIGGSYTWNGLTVGDGPSIGTSGFNSNPMDFTGGITTAGGDALIWAGQTAGIVTGSTGSLNAGAGSITLITPNISGTLPVTTTGTLSLLPNGGSFAGALTFGGTLSSGNFTVNTGYFGDLTINNLAGLAGLVIGRYEGLLNGSTVVAQTNASNITFSTALSLAAPLTVYGGAIALNADITTTNTSTGDVSINGTSISGTGNLVIAAGRTAIINVSAASTYDGVISGTGSGLTKSGSGLLILTKDHTYTGATTISGGDLQVGTGGSLSQTSSGSLATASAVSIAAGSELILSPNDNMTFANPVSGAGAVEVKGMSGRYLNAFITGSPITIATGSSVLEVLTRITGGLQWGASVFTGGVSRMSAAYQKVYNAANNTATLQFQQWDGTYTKVVFARLQQSGSDVQISANTSVYSTGAAYRQANVLGQDMSTGATSYPLATTSTESGYGIAEVYMSGKVNFTGTLTYSGSTILSNTVTNVTSPNTYSYTSRGTQEITDASSSFPSGSAVANNGLVIFNRTTALTISNDLSGTEEILQVGADITMTGTNTYTGATTIDLNKKLNIGSGGTSGSMSGSRIINYGSLTFNRSDASSYAEVISGTGTVTKSGAGALTMSGLNTYTGATTINAGSLILERDVPATGSISFSGSGTLVIQPASTSFTSAVTYPISGFNVSPTIGGLQIGKSGNTANISFTTTTTQASGPITVYGGAVSLDADMTTNTSGDISIYTNSSLAVTGTRTATAAGMFKYMPNGTSFASAVSYPVGNLTVSSNGLQLGKPGNTAGMTISGACTSNGPVSVYTGDFTTNASAELMAIASPLEVTASGNVTLNAALAGSSTTVNVQGNLQTIGTLTNVNLTGSNAQNITGTATLKNLTLNKASGTATMTSGRQDVTDVLTLTSGTLAAGGYMTLKSSATGTARVAQMPATGASITGNVTVERYIPAGRKWRMLTAPVKGSSNNSIFYNWQNNGATTGNNGVDIWGTGGSADPAAGNGLQTGSNPSMRRYDVGWQNVTETKTTALFDETTNNAFAVFVTGPFKNGSVAVSTTTPPVATTLSATGSLITGTHTKTLSASPTAGQFFLVGNPYAAPLYVKDISGSNLTGTFYMWDAAEAGNNQLGKYVGFDRTTGLYTLTTSGFPDSSTRVQSGQAFFVKADQALVNTTITFEEADKALTSSNGMFGQSTLTQYGMLRMTLQQENQGNRYNADGAVALFYANGNPAIDRLDGTKLMNSGENLFMRRSNTSLMFEHRPEVQTTDTIFLRMSNMQQQSYRLQLETKDLGVKEAYLIDPYMKKQIPVTLNGTTDIDFSVTSDTTSTGDRFMVVFSKAASPVLVTPENPVSTKPLTLYPNPVRGSLQVAVNLSEAGPYSVKVYNAVGAAVWQRSGISSGTKKMEINTSGMMSGLYHLVLTDAKGATIVEKFVKE